MPRTVADSSGDIIIATSSLRRLVPACIVSVASLVAAGAWGATLPTPPSVTVERFEVTGNTLLPAEDVDAALAPFRGQRTLDELKQAAAALQAAYRRAGYGAVVVYVPEQTPTGGRVTLAVLEGKLSKIVVLGNKQFSTEAIRRSLPGLQESRTPQVRELDRAIQLANENPARQVAVTLEPGASQGAVDAVVTVTERQVSRWFVNVDNTGDDRTGDWRASLGWRHDNVADRDHQASIQVQTSPTKPRDVLIVTATYGVPFYRAAMRLDAYAAYSDVDGGDTATPVGNLQFAGKGDVIGARVTKLLERVGEIDQRVSVGLDRRNYLNECSIAGLPPGACGPAGESVTAHPLTLDYALQSAGSASLGASLSVSTNLDLGGRYGDPVDFDRVRPGAPLHYTVWRAGGFGATAVFGTWSLKARAQIQLTQDALVPGEQFGLAGATSVRGYEEREIVGDQGYLGSVELTSPELLGDRATDTRSSLRVALFADGGEVRNRLGAACRQGRTTCRLFGAGVGLLWAHGPGQLRLDLARAGSVGNVTDKGDWKLHLAASWSFE